jgi:catechol 2,3-dioxygenase-like lactoylglutathione lyase family enzyme
MIDHVLLEVSNLKKFTAFYKAALKPVGIKILHAGKEFVGFGNDDGMPFHLYAGKKKDRKQVDAFHRQAVKAGGKSNGAPSPKPEHGQYAYSAYVLDPAGNNIEVICYRKP